MPAKSLHREVRRSDRIFAHPQSESRFNWKTRAFFISKFRELECRVQDGNQIYRDSFNISDFPRDSVRSMSALLRRVQMPLAGPVQNDGSQICVYEVCSFHGCEDS